MPVVSIPFLYWPLLLLGSYLLGSVPFAQVLARLNGVDLRESGTGNVGAGNLARTVGWAWAVVAAVLDGLKGLVPVWLASSSGLGPGASGLAGIAAVVGHNWSIWMRGRSGRGLATAAGLIVALDLPLVIWVGGWAVAGWRFGGGIAGFLGWGLLPLVTVAMGRPASESLAVLLLSVILIGRRMQGNIGDARDRQSMMSRALYDVDDRAQPPPESAEKPALP